MTPDVVPVTLSHRMGENVCTFFYFKLINQLDRHLFVEVRVFKVYLINKMPDFVWVKTLFRVLFGVSKRE